MLKNKRALKYTACFFGVPHYVISFDVALQNALGLRPIFIQVFDCVAETHL